MGWGCQFLIISRLNLLQAYGCELVTNKKVLSMVFHRALRDEMLVIVPPAVLGFFHIYLCSTIDLIIL